MALPISIYLFLLIQLLFVSAIDYKTKKISNYWPLMNILVFSVFLFYFPEIYKFEIGSFYFPIGFLLFGFIFFLLGIMGAGDAKYLFSFFLLVPESMQGSAFVALLYPTIFVTLFLMIYNTLRNRKTIAGFIKTREFKKIIGLYGKKFPYAPIVLLAWIWFGWKNQIAN